MIKTTVSICTKYDRKTILEKLKQMMQELEKEGKLIDSGMKVVIKPNLVSARRPEEAATTHPEFIAAVIELCLERGCQIKIAESPSGKMDETRMKMIYQKCGIAQVAKEYGIEMNLSAQAKEMILNNHKIKVPILQDFKEADLIINCSKLKTHSYTVYTGAVKNCFGMIPGLLKAQFHARFSKREQFCGLIADLAASVTNQLCFMDAIVGMHKEGPTNGEPIHIDRILASSNPFALDEAAMSLVNIDSAKVPVQASALSMGLWDPSQLQIIGFDDSLKVNEVFEIPVNLKGLFEIVLSSSAFTHVLSSYPRVNEEKCVGCKECIKDCPAGTIAFINGKANIQKNKCIRCYCCQEVCPAAAVIID